MAQARGQRRNRQQQQGQPRQELSMNDAIATLQAMFDTVDKNVIQMVLVEGCSGNMEQAVEALLKITENQAANGNESNNNNANNNRNNAPTGNGNNNHSAAPAAFGLPQPNEDAIKRATKPPRSRNSNSSNNQRVDKKRNKELMSQQLAQRAQNHQRQNRQNQQSQQQQQQQIPPAAAMNRVVNLPDDFLRPPSYYLERYPKDRQLDIQNHSGNNNNRNNSNADPNFDQKTEREKQIIEDEIFAKAIFEDALFAQDLMNHPEWMDPNYNGNDDNNNGNDSNWISRARSQSNVNSKHKSPFSKNPFRNKRAASTADVNPNGNNNDDIDPSNPNARKAKFKQNLETLGDAAKSKMMNFASKLQRNKEEKRKGNKTTNGVGSSHAPQYSNVLKSIDDETLIDDADDALEIDMATEQNRGTYKPPKPAQAL